MSSTFAQLADLPLEIESCSLRGLAKNFGFERLTTLVCLHGGDEEGVGEDILPFPADHVAFQEAAVPDLAGSWTLAEFGAHVDGLDLFANAPIFEAFRRWRRWAFHSAALDLALRQSARALHDVLGREPATDGVRALGTPRRAALDRGATQSARALSGDAPEAQRGPLMG